MKFQFKPFLVRICAVIVLLGICQTQALSAPLAGTLSSTEPGGNLIALEKVDADVIKQTCELFKVSTLLRTQYGKWPWGTKARLRVVQSINYTCTFAGLLVNMLYNLYFSKHGGSAPVTTQLSATTPRFIGKAIYVGDLLIEIPLEAVEHRKEVKKGYDPGTNLRRALKIKSKLDDLFRSREQLIHQCADVVPADQMKLLNMEGKLLHESSTLAEDEFCMVYARAQSISLRNRVWNGMTLVKKSDATFGADMVRIIAAVTGDGKYLNGPASISTTTSGLMSCFGPETYMLSERSGYNSSFRKAVRALQVDGKQNFSEFETDRHVFQLAAKNVDLSSAPMLSTVFNDHAQIYDSMAGMIDSMNYQRHKELFHQNRHDWHSIMYHTMYGGSKAARGAWLTYVGFAFEHAKGKKEKQRVSLINGYAGILNFSGAAYREVDFMTTNVVQLIHRKRDMINRRADDALIRSRWDMLDTMEDDASRGVALLSGRQVQ